MTKTKEVNHALEQAQAQLASIRSLVAKMIDDSNGDDAQCEARERIHEDALCVEVRSDWHTPGDGAPGKPTHYKILLCTGGPACQITGELSEDCEPETVELKYQDWGTPWTTLPLDGDEEQAVLEYARVFYFGE